MRRGIKTTMTHVKRIAVQFQSRKFNSAAFLAIMILLASCAVLDSSNPNSNHVTDKQITAEFTAPTMTPTSSSTIQPSSTATSTPQPSATPIPFWDGPIKIGESVLGRPIEVYRFGTGPRKLLIIGGIHGGYEYNTIDLMDHLISLLRGRSEWIPDDVTLFILRSLNPDGEMRADNIYGRTNENGVDLNRNFPAQWKKEWPIHGCWQYLPVTAGPYPASEPETIAVMQFIIDEEIIALINYHSAALGIFPGGQPPDEASIRLAETAAAVSDYAYPPIDTGCIFTGQLIDWASEQGIAAIDIELTNHRDADLKVNIEILQVFVQWQP
jgi:hypothetical protein